MPNRNPFVHTLVALSRKGNGNHAASLARGEHQDSKISELLVRIAHADADTVLAELSSHPDGLTPEQVATYRARSGLNEIAHDRPAPWYLQLGLAFLTPFNGVLLTMALVSLAMDVVLAAPQERSWRTVVVLTMMVLLSSLLRFFTEFRSSQAAAALKAMVHTTATVLRRDSEGNATEAEIPLSQLVPGDLVRLSAGDMLPADVRLLNSKDLYVSQSVLTGEALPVEKESTLRATAGATPSANPLELANLAFMGTAIVSGTASAVVVTTGGETYFGSLAKGIVGQHSLTSFDRGVNSVSWLLIRFMAVMVPIVLVINVLTKHNWLEAVLFSLSVAVGLTPEMLPMIVSGNLAKGALAMARKKCIVKQLSAMQNFGAMDVLCTDKTGTLTRDKIILEKHLDLHGQHNPDVLEFAYLNSYYQTGLKNLLDVAVLEHAELKHGLSVEHHYAKVDEIPFDFERRRMSVVVSEKATTHLLICKGAVEEILAICTFAETDADLTNDEFAPLTDEWRAKAMRLAREMNEEGLRVVAVAYKSMPPRAELYSIKDECELVLVGFAGFLDPPKESAEPALRALSDHGVQVKVLTGDNDIVTRKVCRQVGLPFDEIALGSDIEKLDDEALANLAERVNVFAKLSPHQKAQIIRALQSRGHTVGYLGDGINDAAALRDADVGISVDSGADIAKESADIIMLEKNLMVLEEGVLEGRNTFGNIIKYIKMTASSNFGNVFSVLIASAFLPFLPMLPIHLLIQNLLYDFSQTAIPFDRVDEDYLAAPRQWYADDIGRFMRFIGPISSIFDLSTYALMWFVFKANRPAMQSLFQSGWFVEGLLSQTLIIHMIRTPKIPFVQSRAAWPVLLTTLSIMAVGIYVPFSPLGAHIGLCPLPLAYFPWLIGMLLTYCTLTQLVKTWYIRKFGMWL